MATGLIRTLRWERDFDAANIVTLTNEGIIPGAKTLVERVTQCMFHPHRKLRNEEFLFKENELWVARVTGSARTTRFLKMKDGIDEAPPQILEENQSLRLTIKSPGLLDRLVFEGEPIWYQALGSHDVELRIHAAGVNFKDVMIAMGQMAQKSIGLEGAGEVIRIGPSDERSICCEDACGIRTDDAATIPVVFMTVIYSLNHVARLSAGESVLIHAAAGGVGQAAIQVAQIAGAEIFATVSSIEKRACLMEKYGLAEDHIFSTRDLSFVKGIKRMTHGRGVDVVLNSLSGEALQQSWNCVAPFGRFVELGKKDIQANGSLSMYPFLHNVSYSAIDMEPIMKARPKQARALLMEALALFEQGMLRVPSPVTAYSFGDAETAFRKLQTGQAMGKTIIKPHIKETIQVLPTRMSTFQFSQDRSYVLAGGLGGIGRSLARWMYAHGARYFIFLSRSGTSSQDAQLLIRELEKNSCSVKVCICDIGDEAQLRESIDGCNATMPTINGCIQGSMVLEQFQAAIGPKVQGSRNLQHVLGDKLDFFVMLSSITSVVENRGQANYAAGNAYQDAFASHLVSRGIKAVSLNLRSIKTVGYVAENRERMQRQGVITTQWTSISEEDLHSIIEYHIDPRIAFNNAGRFQSVAGLMTASAISRSGQPMPAFMEYPLFKHLHALDLSAVAINNESEFPIQKLLAGCDSLEAASKLVEKALQIQLLSIMSVPKEDFDIHKPLVAYGIDSLIAVELRTWISKSVGADMTILDILGRDSISHFSAKIAAISILVKPAPPSV